MYQGFTYMYFTDWMRYILYGNWLYVVRIKLKKKKNKQNVNTALHSLPVRYLATHIYMFLVVWPLQARTYRGAVTVCISKKGLQIRPILFPP